MYEQDDGAESFSIAWPDLSYLVRLPAFLAMISVLFVDDPLFQSRSGKTDPLARTADDRMRHG